MQWQEEQAKASNLLQPSPMPGLGALEQVANAKTQSGEDDLTGQPNMNDEDAQVDDEAPEIGVEGAVEESISQYDEIGPGDMVAIR